MMEGRMGRKGLEKERAYSHPRNRTQRKSRKKRKLGVTLKRPISKSVNVRGRNCRNQGTDG
jgi:hypothetical protein